jgi:hypothetical protein
LIIADPLESPWATHIDETSPCVSRLVHRLRFQVAPFIASHTFLNRLKGFKEHGELGDRLIIFLAYLGLTYLKVKQS